MLPWHEERGSHRPTKKVKEIVAVVKLVQKKRHRKVYGCEVDEK